MSFLLRGRSSWWLRDQTHPRAAEPAPGTVAAVTGLPVAAQAPRDFTEELRASRRLTREEAEALEARPTYAPFVSRHSTESSRCSCCDGTPADRRWVTAELKRLEKLATLTRQHGPWAAAQHMYGGAR